MELTDSFLAASLIFSTFNSEKPLIFSNLLVVMATKVYVRSAIMYHWGVLWTYSDGANMLGPELANISSADAWIPNQSLVSKADIEVTHHGSADPQYR